MVFVLYIDFISDGPLPFGIGDSNENITLVSVLWISDIFRFCFFSKSGVEGNCCASRCPRHRLLLFTCRLEIGIEIEPKTKIISDLTTYFELGLNNWD